MNAADLCDRPATDLIGLIKRRVVSVREVVTAFLNRIEARNSAYNAIVSLRARGDILADAAAADAAPEATRNAGPLFGLPIAIKDLAQTKGLRTTFGSPIFAEFVPDIDDLHVARIRAAGAIIIGKTNTPEFGLGSHTFNPVFGATRNAYDPALTAGGSSGGAAVALALGMLPIADGSDFGGSLRNPAAYNNVYGFRPSQGRVPSVPAEDPFLSQLSTDGPLGRTVGDLALLLSVQAGWDVRAPLSLDGGGEAFRAPLSAPAKGQRIGWLADLGGALPMEPGVLEVCRRGLDCLGAIGCEVEPVLPSFDFEALWQAFVVLRHYSVGGALRVHYDNPQLRGLLKPEAVFEIEGALRLGLYDLRKAAKLRAQWYAATIALFERFDFLCLPAAQVFPFPVEERWPKTINETAMDSYHRWMQVVTPGTMSGCPVAAVPAGFDGRGRPMGMQIIGPPRRDLDVLRLAHAYEAALGPRRAPPLQRT